MTTFRYSNLSSFPENYLTETYFGTILAHLKICMTPKSVVDTRTTCITSIWSTQPTFQKHKKQSKF